MADYLQRLKTGEIYFRRNGVRARMPDDENSSEFRNKHRELMQQRGLGQETAQAGTATEERTESFHVEEVERGLLGAVLVCLGILRG